MTVQEEEVAVDAQLASRESFEAFYARELRPVIGLAYVLSGAGRVQKIWLKRLF